MGILDFILNLIGLWLWLNWRAAGLSAAAASPGVSLLRTLKRAEPIPAKRWGYLVGLGLLLLFRTVIYRQIGAAVHWTPHLPLGVISLPFRSDAPGPMLLFSLFSFGLVIGLFYLWLIVLSVVNRGLPDADPLQRLARLQLGWVERLPVALRVALPPVVAALLWYALHPLFVPPPKSAWHTAEQALGMGLTAFLPWKYLIVGILLLHVLNSYVYLGNSAFWNYVNATGRNILASVQWLPLRLGRVDLAPVVVIALVVLVAEVLWCTDPSRLWAKWTLQRWWASLW